MRRDGRDGRGGSKRNEDVICVRMKDAFVTYLKHTLCYLGSQT